jgi:fimbrial chaperone protein
MRDFRASAFRLAAGTLVGSLAAAGIAAASSFNIAPIRVEMDRGHQTSVVTLHNEGDGPVTVQVQSVAWSQDEGGDRYEATRDLLVTPPVFVVPAKGDQIVRIARRATIDSPREQAYRLFFQEVPDAAPQNFNGLKIALRIGVPVFVAAPTSAPNDLSWRASWLADGSLRVEATNRGLAHVQITDFAIESGISAVVARIGGSRYLLAGTQASWTVSAPAEVDHAAPLRIRGYSDRGDLVADVAVTAP